MAGPAFDPTTVDTSAVDRLAKIVTGTQNLNTAPDLVGALANGNATPQQAQAIDQYMGALRASQRVRLAQTSGAKVNFTEWEKVQLDQLGIQYGAVEYTSELRNADLIKTATSAGLVAKTDKDGNFIGAITAEQDRQEKDRQAKADSDKGFQFGDLNPFSAVKSAGGAALHKMNQGWNYVSGSVADGAEGLVNNVKDLGGGGANNPSQGANFTTLAAAQDREDATTAGYDPDNPWSMMAYKASGKAYNDTYDLERDYGTDQVSAAKQYLVDPQKFLQSAVADNDADTAANVLTQVNSPEFQDVVRRVASRHAGIGTLVATNLGIDPVEHSRSYMLTAAGVELAAAIALDPTNAVFAGVKAVKAAQIGINGIGDAEKIARTLDTANTAFYAQRVQRGAQSFLDEAKIIREAAPDSLEAAQAFARINARTPGFVQLLPDVQGVRRIDNITGTPNRQGLREVYGVKPIESLDELSDYLASKGGMLRITTGQAAVEGSLMPGAISRAGYRQIRAAMASGSTARSFRITEKNAGKFMPSETDAVAMLGRNGAELTPAELAAAGEGSRRGEAAYTAQARSPLAKMRRSAARISKFLPADTRFALSDAASIDKVRRYAGMYLSKYDANQMAAQFSRADDGARLAILRGMEMQTLHAAGAGHTEAGRRLIDDVAAARNERYGLIDDKLPDGTGSQRSYAIHEYQVTDDFNLPNFRELRKVLAKANVWGYTGGRVLESQVVDEAMSLIKIGWLTTGTNLVRNTGEAWTNVILRGEGRATAAAKAAAGEAGGLASRTALVERLASMPGLPMMGRMVRAMAKAGADDDVLKYIALKAERDGGRAQQRFSEIHTRSYTHQAEDVDTITRAGFGATQGRWKAAGKVITDTDSAVGAERMAENFSRMVGSNSNFIRLVMQAVRAEGPERAAALTATRKHMDTWMPGVWEKARRASVFRDGDGVAQQAVTAEEKVLAKQQQVEAIVEDWRAHLLKSDGTLSTKLIDEIERTGTAPNGAWITANIPDAERPLHTLKADWEPVVPDNKVAGIVGQLSDMAGVGYQKLVQGPIDRMSTSPIFYHQYGLARKGAEGLEKRWISEGMHAETADNILDSWAESVAMQKVFQRTDNPELKTQLDIVGRNFFAFSRATQDFIRRWGSTFIEDPGRLRRAQLTLDAAVSGGIVWTDPTTGNKNFTFPGTGPLIDGLTGLGRRLNLPFVPEIPTSSGMSGRVVFLQPGLQNPAQMSLTPIVNIPMRALMRMLPDNAGMMNELRIQMQHADMLLNGEQGYGKGAVDQLLPSALKKLADATDDDRDGMLASASKEALAALLATGNYDGEMDDNQKQRFLDDVKVQTRNQLILRAIVGFWAPAPPQLSQEGFDEEVDPSYQLLGVQTLHDEFKVILDDAKGDKGKAVAIWAKLHPDKLVYTVAGSEGTTKGAYLPATADTNAWMEENLGWMKDYTNVSAYFIPPATSDDFDMLAWRTQLQLGLRQNKTLEGWYEDAATINAETQYYAEYSVYQQDLADAQLKGDKDLADQLKGQFASWKQDFYAVNPLFKEKQGDYGRSVVNAQHQLDSLRRLTTDGSAPAEVQQVLPGLTDIIAAYDEHKRFAAETEGNTKAAIADRAAEKARYVAYVSGVAESDPALTAVFNGVFRYLDTDMEKVGG